MKRKKNVVRSNFVYASKILCIRISNKITGRVNRSLNITTVLLLQSHSIKLKNRQIAANFENYIHVSNVLKIIIKRNAHLLFDSNLRKFFLGLIIKPF